MTMTTEQNESARAVYTPGKAVRVRKEHIVAGPNGKLHVDSYDEMVHHPYPLHTGTPSYERRGRFGGAQ
jgi:hypothetical protein